MEKSKVYYTDFHTRKLGEGLPTKLQLLAKKAGIANLDLDGKFVAIKMHFGELGNISYYDSSGQQEYNFGKPYSEQTAKVVDEEISSLIETQYTRAVEILSNNRDKLEALAQKLLEKEVIFREDLEEIFGQRAWDPELTEKPVTNAEVLPTTAIEVEVEKQNETPEVQPKLEH